MTTCTGPDPDTGRCAVHGYSCSQPAGGAPMNTGTKDGLGIEILVGDRVMVNAWGGRLRKYHVREEAIVTGTTRPGSLTHDNPDLPTLIPSYVGVLRRDGQPGYEGNTPPEGDRA